MTEGPLTIGDLLHQRDTLLRYLRMKLLVEDFHGVRDCCVDLEVLDGQIQLLRAQEHHEVSDHQ